MTGMARAPKRGWMALRTCSTVAPWRVARRTAQCLWVGVAFGSAVHPEQFEVGVSLLGHAGHDDVLPTNQVADAVHFRELRLDPGVIEGVLVLDVDEPSFAR